jgi:hypothetical protein
MMDLRLTALHGSPRTVVKVGDKEQDLTPEPFAHIMRKMRRLERFVSTGSR